MKNILVLLCLFLVVCAYGQTERRVALVIGNADYPNNPLPNPQNDARDMAIALREAGFEVREEYNRKYKEFNRIVTDFGRSITDPNTVALFYFSGHGVQYGGQSYLVPVDSDNMRDEEDIPAFCVPVSRIIGKMNYASNKINILILDACRSYAVDRGTKNLQTGLAEVTEATPQLLVAYATTPGKVAADQLLGSNGLFTGSLLKHLRTPGMDLHDVFLETRKDVYERSGRRQLPGVNDYVIHDFYFFPGAKPAPSIVEPTTRPTVQPNTPASYTDPLMGRMVFVKGETFTMGCKNGRDTDCSYDDKPPHTVQLSDYYIGETEVTQKQWREVMGSDPPELLFKGCDDCPVEHVSWDDIQEFLSRLNARSSLARYRLPTEAEWEYAARGGPYSKGYSYAGSNNISAVAWYRDNSGSKTHPVKGKDPNELGLYDMSGNVWEWCSDWYDSNYYKNSPASNPTGPTSGSYRVMRGGSWSNVPQVCWVANRSLSFPGNRLLSIGFRLARTK